MQLFIIVCGYPNSLGKFLVRVHADNPNEAFGICRDRLGYVPIREATSDDLED
jgi:hypothetical protein